MGKIIKARKAKKKILKNITSRTNKTTNIFLKSLKK